MKTTIMLFITIVAVSFSAFAGAKVTFKKLGMDRFFMDDNRQINDEVNFRMHSYEKRPININEEAIRLSTLDESEIVEKK